MDKDDAGNSVRKRCWWNVNRCPTGEAQFDKMKEEPSEDTRCDALTALLGIYPKEIAGQMSEDIYRLSVNY